MNAITDTLPILQPKDVKPGDILEIISGRAGSYGELNGRRLTVKTVNPSYHPDYGSLVYFTDWVDGVYLKRFRKIDPAKVPAKNPETPGNKFQSGDVVYAVTDLLEPSQMLMADKPLTVVHCVDDRDKLRKASEMNPRYKVGDYVKCIDAAGNDGSIKDMYGVITVAEKSISDADGGVYLAQFGSAEVYIYGKHLAPMHIYKPGDRFKVTAKFMSWHSDKGKVFEVKSFSPAELTPTGGYVIATAGGGYHGADCEPTTDALTANPSNSLKDAAAKVLETPKIVAKVEPVKAVPVKSVTEFQVGDFVTWDRDVGVVDTKPHLVRKVDSLFADKGSVHREQAWNLTDRGCAYADCMTLIARPKFQTGSLVRVANAQSPQGKASIGKVYKVESVCFDPWPEFAKGVHYLLNGWRSTDSEVCNEWAESQLAKPGEIQQGDLVRIKDAATEYGRGFIGQVGRTVDTDYANDGERCLRMDDYDHRGKKGYRVSHLELVSCMEPVTIVKRMTVQKEEVVADYMPFPYKVGDLVRFTKTYGGYFRVGEVRRVTGIIDSKFDTLYGKAMCVDGPKGNEGFFADGVEKPGKIRKGDHVKLIDSVFDGGSGAYTGMRNRVVQIDMDAPHLGSDAMPYNGTPNDKGYYTFSDYNCALVSHAEPCEPKHPYAAEIRNGTMPAAPAWKCQAPTRKDEIVDMKPMIQEGINTASKAIVKPLENLVASLRAENTALHEDNATLRTAAVESRTLADSLTAEVNRVTRDYVRIKGELANAEGLVARRGGSYARQELPVTLTEKTGKFVAAETTAIGSRIGRLASFTGKTVKGASLLTAAAAKKSWKVTRLGLLLKIFLAASTLVGVAEFAHLGYAYYQSNPNWTAPEAPNPSNPRERAWLEMRAKEAKKSAKATIERINANW